MELGTVRQIDIDQEMQTAYLDYAMSVIVSRALPDVRDGLKPVQRRILYAMHDMGLRPDRPYKKSARIVGECFVAGTRVLTERGLVPVEQVRRGEIVFSQSGSGAVTELFEMPERDLLRVTLENGLSVTVTPAQPFKIINARLEYEWKLARDLTPQDHIVVRASYPDSLPYWQLPAWKGRPVACDENIAYMVGQFLSDGWFEAHGGRWCFYSTSPGVIERVRAALSAAFGYQATVESVPYVFRAQDGRAETDAADSLRDAYQIRVNSKELNRYLCRAFDVSAASKAPGKRIPEPFLRSPRSVVAALLSGLIDGDGSVHVERNVIHYGSVSPELIDTLQILLQHLGVFTQRFKKEAQGSPARTVNGRAIRDQHTFLGLEARGRYAQKLGQILDLAHEAKRGRVQALLLAQLKVAKYDRVPYAAGVLFGELSRHHAGAGWYRDTEGHSFRLGIKYPGGAKIRYSAGLRDGYLGRTQIAEWGIAAKLERIGSDLAPFVDDMLDHDVYFLRVAQVEAASPARTFDLQVAGDHEFVANGLVAHNCLGKYHPHGDSAVYEAMARMAQDFSLRYPLVDGQGNFGSIDGDNPAAMRYTEARLASIAEEVLADIDKDTVDFGPNFDGTLTEPLVLPAVLPNLLLNGASGIAVGMTTNVPPHNLVEVCDAINYLIDNYARLDEVTVEDLSRFVQGPDFPTGGVVYRYAGESDDGDRNDVILNAYAMGRGQLTVQARVHIEEMSRNRSRIVVTELPYQVNKTRLIERIAELVRDGKLEGITDLRDESDRRGMRLIIEMTRTVEPRKTLSQLFKLTPMQITFGMMMVALVDGEPRLLSLKKVLTHYLDHRQEVITRRSKFLLERAKQRAHILEGLLIALDNIDQVIAIIRRSRNTDTARANLISAFKLTEIQAQAILDMPLKRLAALERRRIADEHKETLEQIKYLQGLLRSPAKIRGVIRDELAALKEKYGDARRTQIVDREKGYHTAHDLVEAEEAHVTLWHNGEVTRQAQLPAVGGAMPLAQLKASTRDSLVFFTAAGRAALISVHQVPDDRALPVSGVTAVDRAETPVGAVVLPQPEGEENGAAGYLTLATRGGRIKRVSVTDLASAASRGVVTAINVEAGDQLGWVAVTGGQDEIILVTRQGKAIRFAEEEVRPMGLSAAGVLAIKLGDDDAVIGMGPFRPGSFVVTIGEQGHIKRTSADDFPTQKRYGGGVQAAKVSPRLGLLALAAVAAENERLALLTSQGEVVTAPVKAIPVMGRATTGQKKRLDTKDSLIEPSRQGAPVALAVLAPSGDEPPRKAGPAGGTRAPRSNGAGPAKPAAGGDKGTDAGAKGKGSAGKPAAGSKGGAVADEGKPAAKSKAAAAKSKSEPAGKGKGTAAAVDAKPAARSKGAAAAGKSEPAAKGKGTAAKEGTPAARAKGGAAGSKSEPAAKDKSTAAAGKSKPAARSKAAAATGKSDAAPKRRGTASAKKSGPPAEEASDAAPKPAARARKSPSSTGDEN